MVLRGVSVVRAGLFCLSAGETGGCEGLGGRCLAAETWRLPIVTGQKEGH